MIVFNAIAPLVFFFKRARRSIPVLMIICVMINIGMWYERWVIILSSPGHEFDPYSWSYYQGPLPIEMGIMLGSFGLFFFLFLLFAKFLPSVSMTEMKEDIPAPRRPREER